MSARRPLVEFDQLVDLIDLSIRAPEVKRAFEKVDFMKYREDFGQRGGSPTPYFYAAQSEGFELCCDPEGVIKLVYLYRAVYKRGFMSYRGTLPGGLTFDSSQAEVRALFGAPSRSGAESLVPIVGKVGPWDRWDHIRVSLHFQYTLGARHVAAVTIMSPESVP